MWVRQSRLWDSAKRIGGSLSLALSKKYSKKSYELGNVSNAMNSSRCFVILYCSFLERHTAHSWQQMLMHPSQAEQAAPIQLCSPGQDLKNHQESYLVGINSFVTSKGYLMTAAGRSCFNCDFSGQSVPTAGSG